MDYSKTIGETLAETLSELFVIDDMGIPLNEIRDLATLKGHLAAAEKKYGVKHAKYKALQNLHAAEARKVERLQRIKDRQEHHAKNFGYTAVKGSKRNEWVHKDTGHKLTFGKDRSWSHMKSGGKRAKGGNATPIRDLRRHLKKLHEDVVPQGQELTEIRTLDRLRQRANVALLKGISDPKAQQDLQRALMLHRRKSQIERIPEDENICSECENYIDECECIVREDERLPHWKDGETSTHWATGHPKSASAQHQDAHIRSQREKDAKRSAADDVERKKYAAQADTSRKAADEKKSALEKSKAGCSTCKRGGPGPSHEGSSHCRCGSIASGGIKAHCSCSTCY